MSHPKPTTHGRLVDISDKDAVRSWDDAMARERTKPLPDSGREDSSGVDSGLRPDLIAALANLPSDGLTETEGAAVRTLALFAMKALQADPAVITES